MRNLDDKISPVLKGRAVRSKQSALGDALAKRRANALPADSLAYIVYVYSNPARGAMTTSTVFTNNRTQAVRLPAEARFPESIKKVDVRVVGQERIIAPAEAAWDSFFEGALSATEDFMDERADQRQGEREAF